MKACFLTLVFLVCAGGALCQMTVREPHPLAIDSAMVIYRSSGRTDELFRVLQRLLIITPKDSVNYSQAAFVMGWLLVRDSGAKYLEEVVRLNRSFKSVIKSIIELDSLRRPIPSQSPGVAPLWIHVYRNNCVYHFQDTATVQPARYVSDHEAVLNRLVSYFSAVLPKPVSFFVWTNIGEAEQLLGHELAFSQSEYLICHVSPANTPGHELAHVVSRWGCGQLSMPQFDSRFTQEGIAVAFDFSRRRKWKRAKLLDKQSYPSVTAIWNRENVVHDTLLYPIAGAFFEYLLARLKPDVVCAIVRVQCMEGVRTVLGAARFDEIVREFDKEMNFSGPRK